MKDYKPAIFVLGYSRTNSLRRILDSLNDAVYPHEVDLYISIDGGATEEVVHCARRFHFKHGKIRVIEHSSNIGLREHILWCGDQTKIYGSVIVLEDDLIVSSFFYFYAKEALNNFTNSSLIAGISLYAQRYNEYANLPFDPEFNGRDNYFMQIACSWGQVWSHFQWEQFRTWYAENGNKEFIFNLVDLPKNVKEWPETSWKKYYSAYLVDKKKFFSYPYHSHTTNCADAGGFHSKFQMNILQVSIPFEDNFYIKKYNFIDIEHCKQLYDSFMEPINPYVLKYLNIKSDQVSFDFYGLKSISLLKEREYCITSKEASEIEVYIPLRFRPIELNIKYSTTKKISTPIRLVRSIHLKETSFLKKKFNYFSLIEYNFLFFFGRKNVFLFSLYKLFPFLFSKNR